MLSDLCQKDEGQDCDGQKGEEFAGGLGEDGQGGQDGGQGVIEEKNFSWREAVFEQAIVQMAAVFFEDGMAGSPARPNDPQRVKNRQA